jgi:hypothetical protein
MVTQFGKKPSCGSAHQRGGRWWHFSEDPVRGDSSGCEERTNGVGVEGEAVAWSSVEERVRRKAAAEGSNGCCWTVFNRRGARNGMGRGLGTRS